MLRRTLLISALGAWPAAAWAQTPEAATPPPAARREPEVITPTNALEYAFVSALTNENMRPIFRRYLMETHVALALTEAGEDAAPREIRVREGFNAGAIFTSEQRLQQVLGADAPHVIINGRAALTRLVGKNVVINPGLVPMLTLEPRDLAVYLATQGESSAGPTQ
ncbi:MAG: SseB family protein [Hyphomonadaceae bacterium]|nr:SseB family protein [Hyphomonadaceae bacterium]